MGVKFKHIEIIFYKSFEYYTGIRSKTPFCTERNKPCMSLALKGGFKDAISYNTQPKPLIKLLFYSS